MKKPFFLKNLEIVRLFKKNYQDLVDNLQGSSKFFFMFLILYGFARSLKETRSCSIAKDRRQEFSLGRIQSLVTETVRSR